MRAACCSIVWAGGLCLGLLVLQPAALANCELVTGNVAATPDSRFIASGEIVIDAVTGLVWKQVPEAPSTWAAAQAAAAADSTAGFDDWRLPSRQELASIVETGCVLPSLNTSFFVHGVNALWSSTASVDGRAWYVHFGHGYESTENTAVAFGARFVRGGNVPLFLDGFEP